MMLKNTIYIIIIFGLSFFATSCCSKKYVEIEDDGKLEFNENDMFVYKSNLNNYDTLFIEEVRSEFKYRYTAEDFCGNKIHKEQLIYFFQNYNNHFPKDSLLYLTLAYGTYDNKGLSLRLGTLGNSPYTGDIDLGSGGTFLNKYYLGNDIYNNVRYTTIRNYSDDTPYKFFFNREYGILSYEYPTKEVFALYKYIPKN